MSMVANSVPVAISGLTKMNLLIHHPKAEYTSSHIVRFVVTHCEAVPGASTQKKESKK
jgi:hypothetical protein